MQVAEGCLGYLSHGGMDAGVGAGGVALSDIPFIDFLGVGITS